MIPMTEKQQSNVLYWVEALLSGDYHHTKHKLYDPKTECYCALGVCLASQFVPMTEDKTGFVKLTNLGWKSPRQFFEVTFGLPRNATFYSTMNDASRNYLLVASLLLHHLPTEMANDALLRRKTVCQRVYKEQNDAFQKART